MLRTALDDRMTSIAHPDFTRLVGVEIVSPPR
jgi:hypothetical protein